MKKQRWKITKGVFKYCLVCGKKYRTKNKRDLVCSSDCYMRKYGLTWSKIV